MAEIKIPTTKAELAQLYKLSQGVLKRYLNQDYYTELKSVGYEKKMVTLSPKIVRKFIELHGEPLDQEDFK